MTSGGSSSSKSRPKATTETQAGAPSIEIPEDVEEKEGENQEPECEENLKEQMWKSFDLGQSLRARR